MRRIYVLAGAALALGCTDAPSSSTAPTLAGVVVSGDAHATRQGFGTGHGEKRLILTRLTGDEEVPARPTDAHGQSHVRLSKDGESMDFVLVANNISNVFQAHIHVGPKGENGPIVVWLYPNLTGPALGPPAAGPHNGLLAQGTFNASHVIGMTWEAFLTAVEEGRAYVNVHTNDFVAPPNTGPGDFQGGEIRGQLDKNGH